MRKIFVLVLVFTGFVVNGFVYPKLVLAAPVIGNITVNTPGSIPLYEKFEITFPITNSTASNLQWPFDPNTPAGVTAGNGITVNAVFTNPSGQSFTQPAFFFQPYDFQVKNGQDWLYPVGTPAWMVRFTPNQIGTWSYRLTAQDSGGTTTLQVATQGFNVTSSSNHGFIRISPNDSRYFQFDDGTYFPALGYNMNWDHISWINPVGNLTNHTSNAYNFAQMGSNGIQLVRFWLSQWALFGGKWNPWRCIQDACNADWPELTNTQSYADHNISIAMYASYNPCMSSGHWLSPNIAVKPNTTYRIRVRVKTTGITGPRVASQPYGFVVKITDDGNSWLLGSGNNCQDSGIGKVVSNYLGTSDWTEVTGSYTSGATANFLSSFYLTLTNVSDGSAYVDQVVMEENLGGGNYGPNIIIKPAMNHHQYMDQRTSFAFDKLVDLARQNGVYLRPVILEAQDDAQNKIDSYGFYGNYRQMTPVRWYQQMYWRYLQARYGYSTNIQSWELLNEGDPFSTHLYALTDELGKYMHCRAFGVEPGTGDGNKCTLNHPDSHLVSTSTWSQWPKAGFWANANYPNVDFADVHRYISKSPDSWMDPNFYDTAKSTSDNSLAFGAKTAGGAGKPVIRGESGLIDNTNTDDLTSDLSGDTQGIWLHNFIWGGINPGGLIESYWYESYDSRGHIYTNSFDLRPVYKTYYNFIKDVPLSNGHYVDAVPTTPANIRAWGQKDLTAKAAHLWISNAAYRWNNKTPSAVSGIVTISGFSPNYSYSLQWWNTFSGSISGTNSVNSDASGNLPLAITNLVTDTAVRITDTSVSATPTPTNVPIATSTPAPVPGDANGDTHVDGVDYMAWLNHYQITTNLGPAVGDFNNDTYVDGVDYMVWFNHYGL